MHIHTWKHTYTVIKSLTMASPPVYHELDLYSLSNLATTLTLCTAMYVCTGTNTELKFGKLYRKLSVWPLCVHKCVHYKLKPDKNLLIFCYIILCTLKFTYTCTLHMKHRVIELLNDNSLCVHGVYIHIRAHTLTCIKYT